MNKKTICALIAGFITALGFSSLSDSANADASNPRAKVQLHGNPTTLHTIGMKNDGGWYSSKRHRGHRMHNRIEKFMSRYDTNGDDKISQEEIDVNRAENLAKFDTNNDGKLSLNEFQALWLKHNHERMVRSFQRFDKDGDAEVTVDEYKQPLERFVQRHDRNGDGVVSREDRRKRHGMKRRHNKHHKSGMDPKKEEL